ncbi:signal peptidase I [Bifidobacterium lemurum]|nr:signal peptidase I [Bifidobacterium lemurum]
MTQSYAAQSSEFQFPEPQAYADAIDTEARDARTFQVADHGVDPTPVPPPASSGRHAAARGDSFTFRDMLVWCGVPIIIVLLLRIFLVGLYTIPSRSMMDTIEPGDRVLTSKLTPGVFDLERGDVIVFHDPANWLSSEQNSDIVGDYLIKRLIGLPGDVVACEGPGEPVTINGVAINETSYIRPGVDPSSFAFSVTVTEGHVFVMGDNRSSSADSRFHQDDGSNGLVPISDVVGVGLIRYWPLDRIGLLDAHHEVFADVSDGDASGGSSDSVDSADASVTMLLGVSGASQ